MRVGLHHTRRQMYRKLGAEDYLDHVAYWLLGKREDKEYSSSHMQGWHP